MMEHSEFPVDINIVRNKHVGVPIVNQTHSGADTDSKRVF